MASAVTSTMCRKGTPTARSIPRGHPVERVGAEDDELRPAGLEPPSCPGQELTRLVPSPAPHQRLDVREVDAEEEEPGGSQQPQALGDLLPVDELVVRHRRLPAHPAEEAERLHPASSGRLKWELRTWRQVLPGESEPGDGDVVTVISPPRLVPPIAAAALASAAALAGKWPVNRIRRNPVGWGKTSRLKVV